MHAPTFSAPPYAFSPPAVNAPFRTELREHTSSQPQQSDLFVKLIRNHHREIFHLAHALLRDEVAAEKITQQVFSRARRHMDQGPAAVIEWIYYASFRFVRMCHWRSVGLIVRRRMRRTLTGQQTQLDLKTLVKVIARHPGKIDPRDCELLALRHVLGMPLSNIAQLLRMHPGEVSNRLAWALEHVRKLSCCQPLTLVIEKSADLALSA